MKLAFALFGILLLGILFEVVETYEATWFPPDGVGAFFIFRDFRVHFSSFVYYFIETLSYISLAAIIWFRPSLTYFIKLFVILEFMDLVDFLFTGNTMWFQYHGAPITFNVIKVFIFGSLLAYEILRYVSAKHFA